ncbi:glycosyltransferase family 4 protein [Kitasatospora phosalacinea]|uniref:D-inositol 3-phosphate glycosyltransferase n=1 Tax=Kitasatospora phosalacinea TaxID=2065 RepID=A0ABW6GRA7_9ACTN
MRIAFLINNVYGIGGTNRTVVNLAQGLSARHRVEIVSVFRRQETTRFEIPPGVALTPLVDLRPGGSGADRGHPLLAEPTEEVPPQEEFHAQYSKLSDQRIRAYLEGTDADVVVGTRSSLNLFVARYGREDCVRVAQEHMTHLDIPVEVRAEMARAYPRLDLVTTVTEADARTFRETTPVPSVPVLCVPNSVPEPPVRPADPAARLVVGAGRLDPVKRYDLLVLAFDRLREEFPDWQLRIYGQGTERAALRALISDLRATERILLMGSAAPLDSEWAKGSIAAVTSERESFGMTVVEAMRCGLPVVATDCPVGPREIVRDGEDGLLVPTGDVDGIAAGLRALMADPARRARMATAALANSRRYDPGRIAERYADLFREAAGRRGLHPADDPGTGGAAAPADHQLARGTVRAMGWARRFWTPGTVGKGGLALVSVAAGAAVRITAATAHLDLTDPDPLLAVDLPADQAEGLTLLLREVGDLRSERLLTLPAAPVADPPPGKARLAVRLGPQLREALYEGRWTVVLETASGVRSRVTAGLRETRRLIADRDRLLADPAAPPGVDWLTPYVTKEGHLALRSWRRARHAECTAVRVADDGQLAVEGAVVGAVRLAERPRLQLRRRGATGTVLEYTGRATGRRFRFELSAEELALARLNRWEDWDAWLLPGPAGPGAGRSAADAARTLDVDTGLRAGLDNQTAPVDLEAAAAGAAGAAGAAAADATADAPAAEDPTAPLRIARILDDFADPKPILEYPAALLTDGGAPGYALVLPAARIDVRPYCTGKGELSFQVVERD